MREGQSGYSPAALESGEVKTLSSDAPFFPQATNTRGEEAGPG